MKKNNGGNRASLFSDSVRFENTFDALDDCINHWNEVESKSEQKWRKELYNLCVTVAEDFDDQDDWGFGNEEDED